MSDVFATPRTVAQQAFLSMGFPRQEYWSGLPFPSPGDLLDPGVKLTLPAQQADSSPLNHQGSPYITPYTNSNHPYQGSRNLLRWRGKTDLRTFEGGQEPPRKRAVSGQHQQKEGYKLPGRHEERKATTICFHSGQSQGLRAYSVPIPYSRAQGQKRTRIIPSLREPTNFQPSVNFTQDRPPNNNTDNHRVLNLN